MVTRLVREPGYAGLPGAESGFQLCAISDISSRPPAALHLHALIVAMIGVRAHLLRSRRARQAGFTLAELVIIVAVIGILSITAVPSFLRYYQSAALKSAAQQVAAMINDARELAIKRNDKVCATTGGTTLRYVLVTSGTCTGTAWVGAGTDSAGNIRLPAGITIAASPNPATFDYLGSAVQTPVAPAIYTLTNTQTGATLTVRVAASGRVSIQ